jgi:hypothetical protein
MVSPLLSLRFTWGEGKKPMIIAHFNFRKRHSLAEE